MKLAFSAWQNSSSGLVIRVRPQPVTDVAGQHDPPIAYARQREASQRPAQPRHLQPLMVQGSVQRAVPAPVFGRHRQLDRLPDRTVRAQQSVGELEQRIPAGGQAGVEAGSKPDNTVRDSTRAASSSRLTLMAFVVFNVDFSDKT